jgi:hypothetical protein
MTQRAASVSDAIAGAGVGGQPQGARHARDEPNQQRDAPGERVMGVGEHPNWSWR